MSIASFLYSTQEAGRLGLFVSAIKSEDHSSINRIQSLAAQEGISPPVLTTELLPWLEHAGLCQLERGPNGDIGKVTSLVLAYQDLLSAVCDFYESKDPSDEDRACLAVLALASELPRLESVVRQNVAGEFGEEIASKSLQLAKAYEIVSFLRTVTIHSSMRLVSGQDYILEPHRLSLHLTSQTEKSCST